MSKFGPWNLSTLDDVIRAFKDLGTGLYRLSQENVLREGLISDNLDLPWLDWSPSYSSAYTETNHYYAKYRQVGKTVEYKISTDGTVAGAGNTSIDFTLPVNVTSWGPARLAGAGYVVDGATRVAAVVSAPETSLANDPDWGRVQKTGLGAYTASPTVVGFLVFGSYEID